MDRAERIWGLCKIYYGFFFKGIAAALKTSYGMFKGNTKGV